MTLVLDASITLSWLLSDGKTADRQYAAAVLEAMKSPRTVAEVPVTWGLKIANVLVNAESRGYLNEAQSGAFLEMLSAVRIHVDSATFARALTDTLQLARRYRLSSYDASYLELALRGGLPLASLDAGLTKAAAKAGVPRYEP